MKFDILTIFPHILDSYLNESILGRALKNKLIKIKAHDLRDVTRDKHKTVDDKPYGGGPGMVMMIEPIYKTLKKILGTDFPPARSSQATARVAPTRRSKKTKIILLDPRGKQFDQDKALEFSKLDQLIFICGRYEGIDARIDQFIDEKISIGPYILSGGELGSAVIIESVARLLPGVLGNNKSLTEETFSLSYNKQLTSSQKDKGKISIEYDQYTRPEVFEYKQGLKKIKLKVPQILLSGNHAEIKKWRKEKSNS